MTLVFSILLLLISFIACYFAYSEKKAQIFSTMNLAYTYLMQEYENTLTNFWQIYMPIFEYRNSIYETFNNYFTHTEATDLTPLEKQVLTDTLEQMRVRDNRIEWIALFSDYRSVNYIKYNDNSGVKVLSDSFPYLSDIRARNIRRQTNADPLWQY